MRLYTTHSHSGFLAETVDDLRADKTTRLTFATFTAVLEVFYLATSRPWVKWWDTELCDWVVLLVDTELW